MTILRSLAVAVAAAIVTGCHRYVPATLSELKPNMQVRVDVIPARQLPVTTDRSEASNSGTLAMAGRVSEVRGDTIVLRSPRVYYSDPGLSRGRLSGTVAFVPESNDRIRRRRFDKIATSLAVILPIAFFTAIFLNAEMGG